MPFTPETFTFLVENRLHNSKEWFQEHKPQMQEVVIEPLAELVTRLTPTMEAIDPKFICQPKVGKCISRIHRDVRFSKDKSLYRDIMWVSFSRERSSTTGHPGFFFEISPAQYRYGCGYCLDNTKTMQSLRRLILNSDQAFQEAFAAVEKQSHFGLEGDMYKKSRHPDATEVLRPWLDRKNICFIHNSNDFERLYRQDFAQELAEAFTLLTPVYHFLLKAFEQAC